MEEKKYFKLFASCIPVKGATQSIIFDLDRNELIEIDNMVFDLLKLCEVRNVDAIRAFYNYEFNNGIDEYLNRFVQLELGFFTDIPNSFPSLNREWDSPFHIDTAIFEHRSKLDYNIFHTLHQLEELGCQFIQIFFEDNISVKSISPILDAIEDMRVRGIDLLFRSNKDRKLLSELDVLITNYKKISRITVHGRKESIQSDFSPKIFFLEEKIDITSRNRIKKESFHGDVSFFMSAQKNNAGLNRMIAILANGDIKNHFSHERIVGNVNEDNLDEIIKNKYLLSQWNTPNDKIETCNECQFRYVCADSSELSFKKGKITKIQKCGFDPYQNIWSSQ